MAEDKFAFTRSVIATVRLAQLDLRAVDLFDKTGEAAWSALRFLAYCAPLVFLLAWFSPGLEKFSEATGFTRFEYSILMVELFFVTAFGFMLVVHQLGKRLGYNDKFAHYVTTQCSVALPVVLVIVMLTGLWRLLGVSPESEQLLQVLVYAVQIIIDWAVTYGTLRIRPLAAFGICVLGVLFSKVMELFMILVIMISMSPTVSVPTP